MKMTKEEVIEALQRKVVTYEYDLVGTEVLVVIMDAIKLVKQIDESKPEKSVVSEEEDEWLKRLKIAYPMQTDQLYFISRQGWGHDFGFTSDNTKYTLSYKAYESKEDTEHVKERLINAILHGYTVKKEKRYIVEIPNNVEGRYNLLVKNHEGKIILGNFDNEACKNYPNSKLTEAEIKKDFEWALKFKKEVE